MRRLFSLALILCMACTAASLAEGITLKTSSIFAGTDTAADTYAELLNEWQDQTGNTVLDTSATSDEAWKRSILNDFAAGNEPDVFFFFAGSDATPILNKVVPIKEINAAYPELRLEENLDIAAEDGVVYAIPVRAIWEGLFCNVDLFEQYGLELPTTWEKLETAVQVFRKNEIVPIAVSLSDIPHYITELCILSAGPVEDYLARPRKGEAVPQSWVDGMALIRRLYTIGAFAEDVNATTEAATSQMFRDKKAAMQIDGSWFANGLPSGNMDTTIVMPLPAYAENADPDAFIGGVTMGFYLSRSAWEDTEKRDAAVELLAYLSTGENAGALGDYGFKGKLLESAYAMLSNTDAMYTPFQDEMLKEAREYWFSKVAGIADGTVEPAQMWEEVIAMDPFAP